MRTIKDEAVLAVSVVRDIVVEEVMVMGLLPACLMASMFKAGKLG